MSVQQPLSDTQSLFLADWHALKQVSDRDSQNLILVKKLDAIQWKRIVEPGNLLEYEQKLWELYIEEWDHQEIVNRALRQLGNERRHDWSKDYRYVFTLAGKFQFHIPGEAYEKWFKDEISRHYNLEAHHPEYEINNGTITNLDIQEMAVDRLSRNLWKNDGRINMEQMTRFLPVFHGPNAKANLVKYKLCVDKLKDFMINIYNQAMKVGTCKELLEEMSALDHTLSST